MQRCQQPLGLFLLVAGLNPAVWADQFQFCSGKSGPEQNDLIVSGQILDFFGQTSALVKVNQVWKGNRKFEKNFVIFQNFQKCPGKRENVKIREHLLLLGKSKNQPGIFDLTTNPVKMGHIPASNPNSKTGLAKRHLFWNPFSGKTCGIFIFLNLGGRVGKN